MKVYCEDCRFGKWEVQPIQGNHIDDVNFKWAQNWKCHNPQYAETYSNPINKPFTRPVACRKINAKNDCEGFKKKIFLQKVFT